MTLRVGAIGTGWVSTARHLPSVRMHPSARLEAVCDRRMDRAAEVAREFGASHACTDPGDLLATGVDVVFVSTPPWSHCELAVAALEAGCHVFCEKPMALNHDDAMRMVAAAHSAGRLLCISHNFLFSRSVRRADAELRGAPPSYVWGVQLSSFARRLPEWYEELPGGLMFDESPHLLYMLSHYCGSPLELVEARAVGASSGRWPSSVELLVQGPIAPGQVTMCFETPVSEWHVGVVTGQRVVGLDLFRDICTSVGPDRAHKAFDIARTSTKVIADHVVGYARSGFRLLGNRQFWGHDVLIGRFLDACAHGGPSPVDPLESAAIVGLTERILGELGVSA